MARPSFPLLDKSSRQGHDCSKHGIASMTTYEEDAQERRKGRWFRIRLIEKANEKSLSIGACYIVRDQYPLVTSETNNKDIVPASKGSLLFSFSLL